MNRAAFVLALLLFGCDASDETDAGVAVDAGVADAGEDSGLDAGVDAGPPLPPPPATLSATGLYAAGVDGPYADEVLTYDVRYPLWTDGAEKRRHLLLPPGTSIDTSDPDQWAFPEGTRLFKEFIVGGVPVETRLLWKSGPATSDWVYMAYRFRDDGSDADPVPDGEVDARGTMHDIPDTNACRGCHRGSGDFVLGVGAIQLDRVVFDDWVTRGVLPSDAPWQEPPGADAQRIALGYVHGNCGHCHGERHPLAMQRTLRLFLPVGVTNPWEAPAWATAANQDANHEIGGTRQIIVVGDPDMSQLFERMNLRDELSMPPLGTEQVDPDGLAAVRAWILSAAP